VDEAGVGESAEESSCEHTFGVPARRKIYVGFKYFTQSLHADPEIDNSFERFLLHPFTFIVH
jgi:hypothetical protein